MKITQLAILLMASTGISTACAAAESQESDEKSVVVVAPAKRVVRINGSPVEELDADGDGRLSREEYTASRLERFDEMDANDDDYVDDEEFENWIESRVSEGVERAMERVQVFRRKWDEDGEHVLKLKEMEEHLEESLEGLHERLEGMHERFGEGFELDSNAFVWNGDNGRAFRFAMPGYRLPFDGDMLEELDKDGDGTLSREEFEARKKDPFDLLDKDGDGKLSEEELEGADGHFMVRPFRFRFGSRDEEL